MRECDRHTSESQPGGGVCARCLAERLTWLWRGESFRHGDTVPQTSSATTSSSMAADNSAQPKRLPDAAESSESSSLAGLSLASVRQQLQVLGVARQPPTAVARSVQNENPIGDAVAMAADPTTSKPQDSTSIIEEWTAFHAQRRGNVEPEHALLESPKAKSSNKSLDSMESPKAKSSKSFDSMESPKAKSSKSFDSTESPKAKSSKSFDSIESPKAKSSKSFDSIESLGENGSTTRPVVQPSPELRTLMNAQKMRSQSLPLNFRSAEETAARVINEQADDYLDEDLEMYEVRDGGGGGGEPTGVMMQELHDVPPRCFSPPVWRSPKWVKALGLASPLSSRNRVFPSRSKDTDVRKRSRSKRGARLDSSDWGFKDASGGSGSPLWRSRVQGSLQRSSSRTRSMFSWLQDAESKQDKRRDQTEQQLTSSSSSSLSTDSWLRDLTTVGHLHEIAEELEIVEESSEEDEGEEEESELEYLGDVSSFGKFLLQAAQRHPNARLTRLVSVSSSRRL